ncbi:MAG: alpha-glucosidase/alpha-galactosidase, partial [Acidimicrobiaceae bacterium]|nr:alpha-glucosidase/alpha-galactosidase [Acidimicrobiaceae bacterium]
MAAIAFVGAGSTVFARNLVGDLLAFDDLRDGLELRLHDIDESRLATSEIVTRRIVEARGAAARVSATTDLRTALDGADYVITLFQVGGYEPATVIDFDLPERYGLDQTIADTIGIGGIMRGLRTVPALVEVAEAMKELCPDGLLLNYTNPMAINMWGLAELCPTKAYGLCHSVPLT